MQQPPGELRQHVFRPLTFREIARDLSETAQFPIVVEQSGNRDVGPEALPILSNPPSLLFCSPAGSGFVQ